MDARPKVLKKNSYLLKNDAEYVFFSLKFLVKPWKKSELPLAKNVPQFCKTDLLIGARNGKKNWDEVEICSKACGSEQSKFMPGVNNRL